MFESRNFRTFQSESVTSRSSADWPSPYPRTWARSSEKNAVIAFAVNSVRWNGTFPYPPLASTPATFGLGNARST